MFVFSFHKWIIHFFSLFIDLVTMAHTNVWSNISIQPYWKCRLKLKSDWAYRNLLIVIVLGFLFASAASECPLAETVQQEVAACFRKYEDTRRAYMDTNQTNLFLGIDIEILRAYCSSYSEAMVCVRWMHQTCSDSMRKQIERTIVTIDGYTEELKDLCSTANLYELYAQYMNCFLERRQKSETCYYSKLAYSTQSIYDLSQDELCNRMRDTVLCVENNIRVGCGEKAAELVSLLVKPAVKGSSSCNYYINIDTTIYPTRRKEVTRQTSEADRSRSSQPNNFALTLSVNHVIHVVSILCTLLYLVI